MRYEAQTRVGDHRDVAPRVGVAWGLGPKGKTPKTVIRAGFGIFTVINLGQLQNNNESNPQAGPGLPPVKVWNQAGTDPTAMSIPDPDPGELFGQDMNAQLFGAGKPATGTPTMDGFVINYTGQPGVSAAGARGSAEAGS